MHSGSTRFSLVYLRITFNLSNPLRSRLKYSLTGFVYHLNESSLALYAWDEGTDTWIDASQTCPAGDRYKKLDAANKLFTARICHLSEFALFGYGGENIRMGINYGLDEAAGMYEVGHSFAITVTNSGGTLKATATANTESGGQGTGTGPDFAWSDGFWVQQDDWSDPSIDILPGDWVQFQSDDGFSETVQVGTIKAWLNPGNDSATGSILASGFSGPLQAYAGYWGWFWQEFTADPGGIPFFVDFSPHNLEPDTMVSVGYREPDLDQVTNVFRTPQYEIMLPCTLKEMAP